MLACAKTSSGVGRPSPLGRTKAADAVHCGSFQHVSVFIISACVPSSPVAFPFFRKFCMKALQAFSVMVFCSVHHTVERTHSRRRRISTLLVAIHVSQQSRLEVQDFV